MGSFESLIPSRHTLNSPSRNCGLSGRIGHTDFPHEHLVHIICTPWAVCVTRGGIHRQKKAKVNPHINQFLLTFAFNMTLQSTLNSFSIIHILMHTCGVGLGLVFFLTLKSCFVIFALRSTRTISGSCYFLKFFPDSQKKKKKKEKMSAVVISFQQSVLPKPAIFRFTITRRRLGRL